MKLNNKGFALTSIVYMLIVLFLMLMLLILSNLASRKVVLDKIKYEVKDKLSQGTINNEKVIVTLDPNGGELQNTTKEVMYNSLYGELPTPTREGYVFVGWRGKNMFSGFTKGYYINDTTGQEISKETAAISEYIEVDFTKNSDYYISGLTNSLASFVAAYNENKEFMGRTGGAARSESRLNPSSFNTQLKEVEGPVKYIRITQYKRSDTSGTINDIDNLQIQLEEGSTATDYEPYQIITENTTVSKKENHTLYAVWQDIKYANSCANPNYNPTDESLFTYSDNGDNTVTITGYSGDITDIRIPCTIDGKSVVNIGNNVFSKKNLTSVVIPDSVTSIGDYAFRNNKLTSVVIPDSVISIGTYAFRDNQLTSVVIGNSVTSIGNYAFYGNRLTSVVIPDSVTSIGSDAFESNQLTSVVIGKSVTSIGESAFAFNQLTSVMIPDSVTSIGDDAFRENQLTSVVIGKSVTSIGTYAFRENQLTSVVIPDSVISIGSNAFRENQLTSVVIGKSVTSIGVYAFYKTSTYNKDLTTIYNNTGRSFNWTIITGGSSTATFVTGRVPHISGNITVTTSN